MMTSGLKAGAAALAACVLTVSSAPMPSTAAPTQPREGRTCILPRHVESWAAQGIDTVNIKVNQDYFRLSLAEACPEIQEADRIQLRAKGGGSLVCVDEAAQSEITAFSKVTGPRRCLVRTMQRLTPTDVASLSRKEKP
jgi:hypothetical protein